MEDTENIFNIWIITILVTKTEERAHNTYYIWKSKRKKKRKTFRNIIQESFPKMNEVINVQIERILCDSREKNS